MLDEFRDRALSEVEVGGFLGRVLCVRHDVRVPPLDVGNPSLLRILGDQFRQLGGRGDAGLSRNGGYVSLQG